LRRAAWSQIQGSVVIVFIGELDLAMDWTSPAEQRAFRDEVVRTFIRVLPSRSANACAGIRCASRTQWPGAHLNERGWGAAPAWALRRRRPRPINA
jgi:hypothetical protein